MHPIVEPHGGFGFALGRDLGYGWVRDEGIGNDLRFVSTDDKIDVFDRLFRPPQRSSDFNALGLRQRLQCVEERLCALACDIGAKAAPVRADILDALENVLLGFFAKTLELGEFTVSACQRQGIEVFNAQRLSDGDDFAWAEAGDP